MTEYCVDGTNIGDFNDLCKHFGIDPNGVIGTDDVMRIVHERNGKPYTGHAVVIYNPDRDPEYEIYWY